MISATACRRAVVWIFVDPGFHLRTAVGRGVPRVFVVQHVDDLGCVVIMYIEVLRRESAELAVAPGLRDLRHEKGSGTRPRSPCTEDRPPGGRSSFGPAEAEAISRTTSPVIGLRARHGHAGSGRSPTPASTATWA